MWINEDQINKNSIFIKKIHRVERFVARFRIRSLEKIKLHRLKITYQQKAHEGEYEREISSQLICIKKRKKENAKREAE